MSLLPAFVQTRLRNHESAAGTRADSSRADPLGNDLDDHIFELVPPESAETTAPEIEAPRGQVPPVDMPDLNRLSIDSDRRLYWDGKPVEVRLRISMSRAQAVGAGIVAAFVVIGGIGAALQGAVVARELACRLGWPAGACAVPSGHPRVRSDIPT
jgi:hypothetical protein